MSERFEEQCKCGKISSWCDRARIDDGVKTRR